jgi:hypothetical protein
MQVKDLIVTGDARVVGKLYCQNVDDLQDQLNGLNGEVDGLQDQLNGLSIETWKFTLEDGSIVEKKVCLK